mgnify:CR=1 FL=1
MLGLPVLGYLVFMAFRESSIAELDIAFAEFKAAGVTDLIIDSYFCFSPLKYARYSSDV